MVSEGGPTAKRRLETTSIVTEDAKYCLQESLQNAKERVFETCAAYTELAACQASQSALSRALVACENRASQRTLLVTRGGQADLQAEGKLKEFFIFTTSTPEEAFADLVAETKEAFGLHSEYTIGYRFHVDDPPLTNTIIDDKTLYRAFGLQKEWNLRLFIEAQLQTIQPTNSPSLPPTTRPTKTPSRTPTTRPTKTPSITPTTGSPTAIPSTIPTSSEWTESQSWSQYTGTYGRGCNQGSYGGYNYDSSGCVYQVTVPFTGVYYVFVRLRYWHYNDRTYASWDLSSSSSSPSVSDGYNFSVCDYNCDGNCMYCVTNDSSQNNMWKRSEGKTLTAGLHSYTIGSRPDNGHYTINWDWLVFTTEQNLDPGSVIG